VNPCTALIILLDYKKHESVVQNAGNSAVGLMVGQIEKVLGIKVISAVRARETEEQTTELKNQLYETNSADLVVNEAEFQRSLKRLRNSRPNACIS
jgi:NADPH:quinone reductase-like Zn-dependent oxidoreductase